MHRLGEHVAARALLEDTLARRRQVLGDDHPATLDSANNLANILRDLGEYAAARALDEQTLAEQRRILGDNDLSTLATADNLAADLAAAGEHVAARTLFEDTLARHQRTFGVDHFATLIVAFNLPATCSGWASTSPPAHCRRHPRPAPTGAGRRPPQCSGHGRLTIISLRALGDDAEADRWQSWIDACVRE